jgi:hypothetical protein
MKLHSSMLRCKASFAVLLLSILFYGCRKLDIKTQTDPQKYEHLKQLFFNTDNTNDIEIKNLAANIEKQDSIFKFLPGFAEKNGIPRWDKVIYSTRGKSNLSKKRTPTPATKQSTLEAKENPGIFLIPLQSQNTDEIKAYITAYKHTDSLYSYRLYNKDSMNAIKTESSKSKNNLLTAMAVFGFFEKSINDVDSVVIKAPFNGAIKGVNIELVDETLQKQKLKRNPTPLSQPYIGPDGCIAIVSIQINITSVIIYDPPYTFTTIDWYTIQLYIGIYCNTSTTSNNTGDPYGGGSSGSSNWWNYGSGWPIYSASYDPNWYGWWTTGLGSGGGGTIDPFEYQKTLFDTYSGDEDNNPEGDIDTTTYKPYQLGQPWPTISNVIPESDFVGWGTPGIERNCMSYAKAQIAKKGYKISNYFTTDQTIQLYNSATGENPSAVKEGIGYLISALSRGIPVIVGVDDTPGSSNPQTDNTTDHFIVIVGMGTDSKGNYFTFYDNASGHSNQGTNPNNKLYFDSSKMQLTGRSQTDYASVLRDYIVTMIRKSK